MDNPSIAEFSTFSYLMVRDKYLTIEQVSKRSGIDFSRFDSQGRVSNTKRLKTSDIMKMQDFIKANSYYLAIADTSEPIKVDRRGRIKKKVETKKSLCNPVTVEQAYPVQKSGYDMFVIDKFWQLCKSLIFVSSRESSFHIENETYIDFDKCQVD